MGEVPEEDEELRRLREAKLRELLRRLRERKRRARRRGALSKPVELTDETFEHFIREHELAVVDFWAPWCLPCRVMAPVIEELARDYAGRVAFGKLNVDENLLTPLAFGIQGIPTLIFFRRGRAVDRLVGAVPRQVVEARLKRLMR
ncbi:MAG TPA: thioredoxin [Candidatus Bathyarchaeota archaeon]|nr:MAG: thioredoxin [Candidatus Bathyarchaeota archaeon]HDJ25747.1 thioredoxin [Candidatus Bathyarchaeota archaeon]